MMWEGILHAVVCVCRGSSKAAALKVNGRSQRARERHYSEGRRYVKIVIPRISAFGSDSDLQKAYLQIYKESAICVALRQGI
jgi:hypothetical protein